MPTTQGDIFIKAQCTEVNNYGHQVHLQRCYGRTYRTNNAICYINCMASVQETSHCVRESRKCFKYDAIFCSK